MKQMHYSGLEKLSSCGEAFRRRYIERERGVSPSYIHVGRAVDHAANSTMQSKIDTNALLPVEQVVDEARDVAVKSMEDDGLMLQPEETGAGEGAAKAEVIDKTVRLSTAYASILAPRLKPKRVQAKWSLVIPGMPFELVGTRDLDETTGAIIDLKTSKRSPKKTEAQVSDQLTTYALSVAVIDKAPVPVTVGLDYIVDLKSGSKVADRLVSTRGKDDFGVIIARLERASQVIESGAFQPASQGRDWQCSLKYCEFAYNCRFFRKSLETPESE